MSVNVTNDQNRSSRALQDKNRDFLNRLTQPLKKGDRETAKTKYYDRNPHPNLHNFHTIKWFRRRVNESVIYRSINTMLPNNGLPVEDPNKTVTDMDKCKEWLTTHCKPNDKFKNIHITPKYFFSQLIMNKIKKLRDIFVEFDADGSRKLEIDEMVTMFNTNNIPVETEELLNLFFKDKKLPKGEDPYLDFYQFMEFALSKICDQDFRLFMRMLKVKIAKLKADSSQKNLLTIKEHNDKKEEEDEEESMDATHLKEDGKKKEEDILFLPMNFNLVLDYFNNKGKQRENEDKIKKAVDTMDVITNGGNQTKEGDESGGNKFGENNDTINSKDENENANKAADNLKLVDVEENLKIHDEIITDELLEEFRQLFEQKHASENSNNSNRMARRILGLDTNTENSKLPSRDFTRMNTFRPSLLNPKILPTNLSTYKTNTLNTDRTRTLQQVDYENDYKNQQGNFNLVYTNMIRKKMEKANSKDLTKQYYDKYKSVLVATEEARKKLNTPFNSTGFSYNAGMKTTATKFRKTHDMILCKNKENPRDNLRKNSAQYSIRSRDSINLPDIIHDRSSLKSAATGMLSSNRNLMNNLNNFNNLNNLNNLNNDHIPKGLLRELNRKNY
jgi:hypothetical protein